MEAGFQTGIQRVGGTADFNPESRVAQETIRQLAEKMEGVIRTTEDDLRRQVQQGLQNNESVGTIAGRIRQYVEDDGEHRAETIAQTTVTGGFESQQLEAFRTAGFEGKRWLTQRDDRVRESHQDAGRQQRPLDVPFTVGGAQLMYPSDPNGPSDEVVNCRCTMVPIKDLERTDPEGFTP